MKVSTTHSLISKDNQKIFGELYSIDRKHPNILVFEGDNRPVTTIYSTEINISINDITISGIIPRQDLGNGICETVDITFDIENQ